MTNRAWIMGLALISPSLWAQDYPHAAEPIGTVRQIYDGVLPFDVAVRTFRNIDRLFPTRVVPRSRTPLPLPAYPAPFPQIRFADRDSQYTLDRYLELNRVTGLLVLQDGRIRLERYLHGNSPRTRWMSMSVAKSITSTLIGAAIHEGRLSLNDSVVKHVPSLAGSAYDGATVRDVLMMASGVRWNETYTDPRSDRRRLLEAQISQRPGSALEVMRALPRAAEPGTTNNYNTGETQVAGEIVRSAAGKPLATYLAERVWSKVGMESDAHWWLDSPNGVEIGGSGFSATLRDYARFGQFILDDGVAQGERILPEGWVREAASGKTLKGGAPLDFYGYLWWPGTSDAAKRDRAFSADGIYGQHIYVNPATRVVIVQWGAQAKPVGTNVVDEWKFFDAVAAALPRPAEPLEPLARSSLATIDGRTSLPGLRDSVEVLRDRWGVPHLYARNLDDLFFTQGFVQAQDRLWQMEMYRRTHEGSLSEIMGPAYARHDRLVRLLRFRDIDDREWASYHPDGRRIFQAFANGVNAYIAHAGDRLPVEFRLTGIRPRPWTAEIALLRTQTAMPTSDASDELQLARDVARLGVDSANRAARPSPYRELVVPNGVDLSLISAEVVQALRELRQGVVRPELLPEFATRRDATPSENRGVQENSPGSNNWVTGPALSANGHVVVANDPHRNVANPSIRYVVHLNAPGWNVIGATEPVLPGVMIGHTERIGWGLTIVGTDQADVYVEKVNPANRNEVRYRGAWEPLRAETDTIPVKGSLPLIVTHKFSRHGPVFYEDTVHHTAYALRSTMHMRGTAGYLSALRYHTIQDCAGFLEAQRYYLAPSENMICGDVRGNIAWQASAASPRRPNWHGRLPVPGTGEYEWDSLRVDLPREFNPPRGWIATANHDIHPPGYDPPLFFSAGPADARFRRIRDILSSGRKLSLADHAAMQHDAQNRNYPADARLFAGWTSSDSLIERARRALSSWDGQHRRESFAAAVYRFAGPQIPAAARQQRDPAQRRSSLEPVLLRAVDSLRARIGNDPAQWRWGRFNTSQFPHSLVRAFDISGVERHGGAGFVASVGATYRQIIDMNDLDASIATNAPGQSGQPFSPFYQNLAESYGRAEYFPLAFSRAAVERVVAHRLLLVPR